ncbi:MAG: PEGA domain-containing protein [Deltaproteobacteria bacterium]|nr:PEGA domain-containing protein [Deltaproteobacteria bacterium]MDQ3297700.1 PEGA domain-containing protein [Myxococcota bacterium]
MATWMEPVIARRIIAVSPDESFGQVLASALRDAGTVELHDWLDPVEVAHAALCVVHLTTLAAIEPLQAPGCPVIAVLPRSDLADIVELLQSVPRIAGIAMAEDLDAGQLGAMAARALAITTGEDRFGLQRVVESGTEIHSLTVHDYPEKRRCMAQIEHAADQHGVPRKYLEPIQQCLDEMLMNALYDAPVNAEGQHIFAGVPTKKRITMRTNHQVVVQYAFDGKRFAVSVRDAFGTLERLTMLRFLHKSLHASVAVDRRAGGAGLGLYLMVSSVSAVYFHVVPGVATEAVCVFDVARDKLQLDQLGFFVQPAAAGHAASEPARAIALPSLRRKVLWSLPFVVVAAVLFGVFALPRLLAPPPSASLSFKTIPPGATIEVNGRAIGIATDGTLAMTDVEIGRRYTAGARLEGYEPQELAVTPREGANAVTFELRALATVELDSDPTGATVTIAGKPMGSTPLTLTSLEPGSTVTIVFERAGHRTGTASVRVPAAGGVERLVQRLEVSDDFVRVRFVSNPPGAEIVRDGQAATTDRTYTPAELFLEVGQVQRFTLTMPRHAPLVIAPFTPNRGDTKLVKGGDLPRLEP